MKKILLFSLIAILALGSVQAQKKTKRLSPAAAKGQKEIPAAVELKSEPILLPDAIEGLELPLFDALKLRCTYRDFTEEELSLELISSLLWSAYGINRPEEGKRVAPSAVNVQEFDIYLFTREGIYIYDAAKNTIQMVVQGDHRAEISNQKHFAVAPVSLLIVANYQRMSIFKDKEVRDFYAAVDCGYVSQNIYLFCASAKLGTVACGGIERDHLHKLLGITSGKALLAHPVGFHK